MLPPVFESEKSQRGNEEVLLPNKPVLQYAVIMHQWGEDEGHSYLLGVWPTYKLAEEKMKETEVDRGGKYEGRIHGVPFSGYVVEKWINR